MASDPDTRLWALGFSTGAFTTTVVLLLFALTVGYEVGYPRLAAQTRNLLLSAFASKTTRVLELPGPIRDELTALEAVVSNAGNPTNARAHDTIMARPDGRFGYLLRPSSIVRCHMLRARNPVNLDPPVLCLREGSELSPDLEAYLAAQSRLDYVYTVGADGLRTTLPAVRSEKRLLMVGDSMSFGAGVGDSETVASALQRLVGTELQVINAGVPGYSGWQALETARAYAERGRYAALVYLTSQNDFMEDGGDYAATARGILSDLAELGASFPGGIVVVIAGYMQYVLLDVLGDNVLQQGWGDERIRGSEVLFRDLPGITGSLGLEHVDWIDLARRYTEEERSIFSRFGLYVDHSHFSPVASRRVAEQIHATLVRRGVVAPRLAARGDASPGRVGDAPRRSTRLPSRP